MREQLKKALETQRKLQKIIEEVQGVPLKSIDRRHLRAAMLAEFGELLQEIKPLWAWWKRSDKAPKPIDRDRVLEELADILHFWLILHLRVFGEDHPGVKLTPNPGLDCPEDLINLIYDLVYEINGCGVIDTGSYIFWIAECFGFTADDLFDAYHRKAEENIRRWT